MSGAAQSMGLGPPPHAHPARSSTPHSEWALPLGRADLRSHSLPRLGQCGAVGVGVGAGPRPEP